MAFRRRLRAGLASGLDTYKDILLRRRQLKEENQQAAERISMGMGPAMAQVGLGFQRGDYDEGGAQAMLEALTGPLKQFGATPPDFDLGKFRPTPEAIAGPVFEKLTPETSEEQLTTMLNRRPGGKLLTEPQFGEMPGPLPKTYTTGMEIAGGELPSRQFGPVRNPMISKGLGEIETLGKQEEAKALTDFQRTQKFEEMAFPRKLRETGQLGRQAKGLEMEFTGPIARQLAEVQKETALDPQIRAANKADQKELAENQAQLQLKYGPVRITPEGQVTQDTPVDFQANGQPRYIVPKGEVGYFFIDGKGNRVGFQRSRGFMNISPYTPNIGLGGPGLGFGAAPGGGFPVGLTPQQIEEIRKMQEELAALDKQAAEK